LLMSEEFTQLPVNAPRRKDRSMNCSMHPPPLGFATVALDAYLRHAEAHLTLSAGLPQLSVAAYYPPRLPPPGIPLAVPQPSAAAPARHLMLTSHQLPNRNPNQVVLDENRFEHLHRYEKLLQECAKELTTSPHSDRLLTARPFTSSPPASAVEAASEATKVAAPADDTPGAALRRVDNLVNKLAQQKSRMRKSK
jgi:hypothetical protein